MQDIDALIAFVAKNFPFDEKAYPELRGKDKTQRLVFALRHSALHFSKTAGKIATISERVDHGEAIDLDALRLDASKAFVNVLRLAELVGLTGDELVRSIEDRFQERAAETSL